MPEWIFKLRRHGKWAIQRKRKSTAVLIPSSKPHVSSENVPIFDPDKAQLCLLLLFVRYRCFPLLDTPNVRRMDVGFIANFFLVAKIRRFGRNRFDLHWPPGQFYWRYRKRVKVH